MAFVMRPFVLIEPIDPRSSRHCSLARRFDHDLVVEGLDQRRARYTDRIEIEPGILTRLAGCLRWDCWLGASAMAGPRRQQNAAAIGGFMTARWGGEAGRRRHHGSCARSEFRR